MSQGSEAQRLSPGPISTSAPASPGTSRLASTKGSPCSNSPTHYTVPGAAEVHGFFFFSIFLILVSVVFFNQLFIIYVYKYIYIHNAHLRGTTGSSSSSFDVFTPGLVSYACWAHFPSSDLVAGSESTTTPASTPVQHSSRPCRSSEIPSWAAVYQSGAQKTWTFEARVRVPA